MNITIEASKLNWMTNGLGLWAVMLYDLDGNTVTFSEGYTPTVSNKLVKVTNATRPAGTLTYDSTDDTLIKTSEMHGIGNARDEEDKITGEREQRIGNVDLSTLEWTHSNNSTYGYWISSGLASSIKIPASVTSIPNVAWNFGNGVTSISSLTGGDAYVGYIAVATNGNIYINNGSTAVAPSGMLFFEMATPVKSSVTPVQITLAEGGNVIAQTDGGRFADIEMIYENNPALSE